MNVHQLMEHRDCVVTLEMPDGTILSGTATAAEVSVHQDVARVGEVGNDAWHVVPLLQSWEVTLLGQGDLMTGQEYAAKADQKAKAEFWTCPYCARVHSVKLVKCWDGEDGCGASRPITGVVDL